MILVKRAAFIIAFFCFIMGVLNRAASQRLSISYEDYTKAIGMEDDYIVMKNILRGGLMNRVEDRPKEYYEDNAEFFSMVLLLSGVTPSGYYKLEQNGVDVIHAITADVRPFEEQSLLSDLAVIGTVVDEAPEQSEEDGFSRTLFVQISEVLKGSAPVDTIQIRRRDVTGISGNDIQPELSRSYLFLLSSGMYGYHKADHQFRNKNEVIVSAPQLGQEQVFLIYRIYPHINGQLYYSPQTKRDAASSLRMVDILLNQQ
jgi:hypothetical protein